MMAAAGDEQQAAAAREALPAPSGERYDDADTAPSPLASDAPDSGRRPESTPTA